MMIIERLPRRAAAAALVTALLAGCAVRGDPFARAPAASGEATIYVYRPYHFGSSLLRPVVTCGGEKAALGPGGYHAFVLPAGHIDCVVYGGETHDEVEIDAAPRVYYIREEFGWGAFSGHPHLNPIDTDTAHDEIKACCVEQPATP